MRLSESQSGGLSCYFPFVEEAVALVEDDSYFGMFSKGFEVLSEFDLVAGDWFFGVDDEEDEVGFVYGCYCLFEDLFSERCSCGCSFFEKVCFNAGGIDD